MSERIETPWKHEDCLPQKPEGKEYGYLRMGVFVTCYRDELILRCSRVEMPEIELIWHPEAPRLVHVATVPFLREALQQREKSRQRQNIGMGVLNLCLFSLLALLVWEEKSFLLFACLAVLTGGWPLLQAFRARRKSRHVKVDQQETSIPEVPDTRYAAWLASRRVVVVWVIFGGIALIGALQALKGYSDSIAAAGLLKHSVRDGQWWRLCTAPFLHGNPIHLIFNISALVVFGRLCEVLGSRWHMAVVFMFSAICGSFFSLILLPDTDSVGASGGLLGLIGFLVVLGYRRRQVLPPGFVRSFAVSIAIIAGMGLLAYEIIDNAAHFGGFLGGVLAGVILVPRTGGLPLPPTPLVKLIGLGAVASIVVFTIFSMWKIFTL